MSSLFKRGRWYWLRYTLNGTQCRFSLKTTSKKVAESKKRDIEHQLERGTFYSPSKTPIGTFLPHFLNQLQQVRRNKSWVNEANRLTYFFRSAPFHLLEHLTVAVIAERLKQLAQASRGKKWQPATYNRYREALAAMFDYAIECWSFVSRDPRHENPARGVKRRSIPKSEIVYLNESQIRALLAALERPSSPPRKMDRQLLTMVATLIFAGLRREELLWLRNKDVDLETRTIRICSKEHNGVLWTPKTNADRAVPVSEDLMRFLDAYEPPEKTRWFFPSPKELVRWDPDNFGKELSRVQRIRAQGRTVKGQLQPHGCNVFRHTFATILAKRGNSLAQIAKLMGNSVAIVEKHYAAFVTGEMRDVVEMGIYGEVDNPVGPATGAAASVQVAPEPAGDPERRGKVIYLPGAWRGSRSGQSTP